jgi:hypothetical protein
VQHVPPGKIASDNFCGSSKTLHALNHRLSGDTVAPGKRDFLHLRLPWARETPTLPCSADRPHSLLVDHPDRADREASDQQTVNQK